jgi:hypothetical protein
VTMYPSIPQCQNDNKPLYRNNPDERSIKQMNVYSLNTCYRSGTNNNVFTTDFKFTDCNWKATNSRVANQVDVTTYTTTDGSCGGTGTSSSFDDSDYCANPGKFFYVLPLDDPVPVVYSMACFK